MNIKNVMCKLMLVVISLFVFVPSTIIVSSADDEHWASDVMEKWQYMGIIMGNVDGTKGTGEYLNRIEAATILNRINNIEIEVEREDDKYRDVESFRWYYPEVEKAIATGILNGTPTGEIKPKELISREEAFKMVAVLFDIKYRGSQDPKVYLSNKFADGNTTGGWSSPYVAGLVELGYISGYDDSTLNPKSNITKGEFITLLDNIIDVLITEPGEYDLADETGIVVINVNDVKIVGSNGNSKVYLTGGNNNEVEMVEDIDDELMPESISKIGAISSVIDYSKFTPSEYEKALKEAKEYIANFKMPTSDMITSSQNMHLKVRTSGTDKWNDLIVKVSLEEDIDPIFVKCVMAKESSGRVSAVNHKNANGTSDYGIMQVNTGWGTSFNYQRMLTDHEYAIRCGIIVIKRKMEAAERSGRPATIHEVAWRYNGYSAKGKLYADELSGLYEELSGLKRTNLVRTSERETIEKVNS